MRLEEVFNMAASIANEKTPLNILQPLDPLAKRRGVISKTYFVHPRAFRLISWGTGDVFFR